MSRNSLYSSWIFLLSGSLPEMVSPVQRTKAAAGFKPLTAANIFPGVGGCLQLLCAGRLSPASTKVNFAGSAGADKVPVLGRGARAGIWPKATVQKTVKLNATTQTARKHFCRFINVPFVVVQGPLGSWSTRG